MLIQVLGTGCPKCKKLTENATAAVNELGVDCKIEKVTNLNDISAFGVVSTPALVIDGVIKSSGKVTDVAEIKEMLLSGGAQTGSTPAKEETSSSCCCSAPVKGEAEEEVGCGCMSSSGNGQKNTSMMKIVILLVVAIALVGVFVSKNKNKSETTASGEFKAQAVNRKGENLPRMLEFGSTTCVPCKMMEPVLESLREKYPESLSVEFYNVEMEANKKIGGSFKITMIPTQIFLNAEGKEVFRHEGFFPEEDILKKWQELGITLQATAK